MNARSDAADVDSLAVCYRCGRALDADRWLCVSARPGPGLADAYEPVSRPCCPDCVAAIGLLEIVAARW